MNRYDSEASSSNDDVLDVLSKDLEYEDKVVVWEWSEIAENQDEIEIFNLSVAKELATPRQIMESDLCRYLQQNYYQAKTQHTGNNVFLSELRAKIAAKAILELRGEGAADDGYKNIKQNVKWASEYARFLAAEKNREEYGVVNPTIAPIASFECACGITEESDIFSKTYKNNYYLVLEGIIRNHKELLKNPYFKSIQAAANARAKTKKRELGGLGKQFSDLVNRDADVPVWSYAGISEVSDESILGVLAKAQEFVKNQAKIVDVNKRKIVRGICDYILKNNSYYLYLQRGQGSFAKLRFGFCREPALSKLKAQIAAKAIFILIFVPGIASKTVIKNIRWISEYARFKIAETHYKENGVYRPRITPITGLECACGVTEDVLSTKYRNDYWLVKEKILHCDGELIENPYFMAEYDREKAKFQATAAKDRCWNWDEISGFTDENIRVEAHNIYFDSGRKLLDLHAKQLSEKERMLQKLYNYILIGASRVLGLSYLGYHLNQASAVNVEDRYLATLALKIAITAVFELRKNKGSDDIYICAQVKSYIKFASEYARFLASEQEHEEQWSYVSKSYVAEIPSRIGLECLCGITKKEDVFSAIENAEYLQVRKKIREGDQKLLVNPYFYKLSERLCKQEQCKSTLRKFDLQDLKDVTPSLGEDIRCWRFDSIAQINGFSIIKIFDFLNSIIKFFAKFVNSPPRSYFFAKKT